MANSAPPARPAAAAANGPMNKITANAIPATVEGCPATDLLMTIAAVSMTTIYTTDNDSRPVDDQTSTAVKYGRTRLVG